MDDMPSNPPPPPPAAAVPPPLTPASSQASQAGDDKLLVLLCHLSYFFLALFFPLIIYLVKKDQNSWLTEQAREVLNFHITLLIVCIGLAITLVGLFLIPVVSIGALILSIIGAVKANDGVSYRYPFCLRLVK